MSNERVQEIVMDLMGDHMGGLSPHYLAAEYAERTGASRDQTEADLNAAVKSGALVAFTFDGFPMVTLADRAPKVTTPAETTGGAR